MEQRRMVKMLRNYSVAIAALMLLCGCRPDATRRAIASQLDLYPESRVQDIYKNFCQDNLGPGHLISYSEAARSYLMYELDSYQADLDSARYDKPALRYVPVGDEGNFVRVDLSVVLDGLVDAETLLDAFVRSANEGKVVTVEEWKAKWASVAAVLQKDFPGIPDAGQDLAAIDSLMAAGHFILHHSPEFEEAYHPHYRIVARDIFEQELKATAGL